jgi:hypothetical protein
MGLFLKIKNFWKNFHDQLWGRISKKGTGGLWEGDNTPIGGGYMSLYAPQMPQFWLVLYIYIILHYCNHNDLGRGQKKSI